MAEIWLERGVKRQLVSLLLFETPSRLRTLAQGGASSAPFAYRGTDFDLVRLGLSQFQS